MGTSDCATAPANYIKAYCPSGPRLYSFRPYSVKDIPLFLTDSFNLAKSNVPVLTFVALSK
jgi:hypothetical protein